MYCPKCGQAKVSNDTNFCSRCGFLLTGTADLLNTGGLSPYQTKAAPYEPPSPRSKGIKKGVFIFLLSFLIVPLITVILLASNARSPVVAIVAAILFSAGGFLRIAYAWMFESPVAEGSIHGANATELRGLNDIPANAQLPPQQTIPASSFVAPASGLWRNTNELEVGSVTEGTTQLLEKEETN